MASSLAEQRSGTLRSAAVTVCSICTGCGQGFTPPNYDDAPPRVRAILDDPIIRGLCHECKSQVIERAIEKKIERGDLDEDDGAA
jgi:hypothetical protein